MTPKRALVTGGADGIGWAICQDLAQAGYLCAVADIDIDKARSRAQDLGLQHVAIEVDLSDVAQARELAARAHAVLGGLDLIVNNAGITDTAGKRIPEMDAGKFAAISAVNLASVMAICRAGAEVIGPQGRIINLASGASFRPLPLRGPYSATKAGVVELTRSLAQAWPQGPGISAVAPGYIRTPLVEALIENGRINPDAVARGIPRGRLGRPDDIAQAVTFLASPEGAIANGQCLSVDGGVLASAGATFDHTGDPQDGGDEVCVLGQGDLAEAVASALGTAPTTSLGRGPLVVVIDVTQDEWNDPLETLRRLDIDRGAASGPVLFICEEATDANAETRTLNRAVGMYARTRALEEAASGQRINAVIGRRGDHALAGLAKFLMSERADYVQAQSIDLMAAL